eukprot:jgi/Hompol1/1350/HPOL_005572-RA
MPTNAFMYGLVLPIEYNAIQSNAMQG